MIKSIEIENFQSHKKTKIKLAKGITVIVGKSLAGKTAIARALIWNIFNRPTGTKFRSNFSDSTEATQVIVRTDDETITHRRTKTKNQYLVGDRIFSKVGTAVPDLVKEALNLSEINIQNQLDQHYLITSTPGQVTKEINKIIGADKADLWSKIITSKINYLKNIITIHKKNKKQDMKELKKYKIISGLVQFHKKAEVLLNQVFLAEGRNEQLDTLINRWGELTQSINNAQVAMRAEDHLDKAEALQQENNNLSNINQQLTEFVNLNKLIKEYKRDMEYIRDRYIGALQQQDVCPVCFSEIDSITINRIIENI